MLKVVLIPQALTTAGAHSVWATVQVLTNQDMMPSSPPDSLLLHWNGQAWNWIPLPDGDEAEPAIASDGAHGAWVVGTGIPYLDCGTVPSHYFLDWTGLDAAGRLSSSPTQGIHGTAVTTFDVFSLAHISGTQSVLASSQVDYNTPSGTTASAVIYRCGRSQPSLTSQVRGSRLTARSE
jgi:hypothetical protein